MAKYLFKQRSLVDSSLYSSVPLVVPNDMQYDVSSNTMRKIPDATRQSLYTVTESIELLNKIKKPIAVLSIAGPYRSGKSYILSRLLGSHDAFQLGHTMNAKTFGIWMGTTILECDDYAIVLLDTEGIDAADSSEEGDASVLVLTILLSSYFIYNSLSVPRKQDLEKMSMFLQLASSIAVRSGEENDANELRRFFPEFLWLLRDVHLLPADEKGEEISATEYLKTKVLVRGKGFFESKTDTIARALLAFFPSIECRTLPPPSTSAAVMQNVGNKCSELNPEFNLGVEELLRYLEKVIKVKKGFEGGQVNGPIMASLVNKYVSAINTPGAIPTLNDAWQSTIILQQQGIISELVEEYISDLNKAITQAGGFPLEEEDTTAEGMEDATLMNLHNQVLSDKMKKLIEIASLYIKSGEEEHLMKELEDKIVQYETKPYDHNGRTWDKKIVIGGVLYTFTAENLKMSSEYCCNLIKHLYKPIQSNINGLNPDYTFQNLLEDLAVMHSTYFSQAKGPAKLDVYEKQRQDMELDKEKFTQLKEYEADIQKAAEEAERANQENIRVAAEVNALRSQVIREAEMHKKTMEEMNKAQEEAVRRIQKEEEERRVQEQKKFEDFQKAQMEEMAKITKENQLAKEKEQQMMLDMMKQQQEAHRKAIEQMNKVAQTAPPRQKSPKLIKFSLPLLSDKCKIM